MNFDVDKFKKDLKGVLNATVVDELIQKKVVDREKLHKQLKENRRQRVDALMITGKRKRRVSTRASQAIAFLTKINFCTEVEKGGRTFLVLNNDFIPSNQ